MAGHHPFSRLTEALSPASRSRIEARKEELRASMLLHDPRQARAMTQKPDQEAQTAPTPARTAPGPRAWD